MSKFLLWTAGIIAATVIFVSTGAAAGLVKTVYGTTGTTTGLMVGGVPVFLTTFRDGVKMGADGAQLGGAGYTGTSWQGGVSSWTQPLEQQRLEQQPAPRPQAPERQQRRGVEPVKGEQPSKGPA